MIFVNTLNSKTNESNKFIYQFNDKLNLQNPNKNMALANFKYLLKLFGKTLNLNTTTINIKSVLQLGIMSLICLMGATILNTSLKSTKL